MKKKRKRQIFFVCASISNEGKLIFDTIVATSIIEVATIFFDKYHVKPQEISGPFYKKKVFLQENTKKLIFSNLSKKAEYNGWIVNAIILKEPADHAFLLFKNKINGECSPKPQGTTVVPIYSLRFIDVE